MTDKQPAPTAAEEIHGYQQAMKQTGSGTASVQASQLARWHAAIERKDALLKQALAVLEQHIAKFDSESFTSVCELDDAKDLCDTIKEELQ